MKEWFKLLRPKHWIKNILCFAGVFFAERFDIESFAAAFFVALFFSLCSSAVYIFNDMIDRHRDRDHPTKKIRPIASGKIGLIGAAVACAMLLLVTTVGSFIFNKAVFVCLFLYVVNNIIYSLWLKHKSLLDVLSIAFGFMLRLFAGVYVFGEKPTVWFSLCTFFLTLLFGFSKRRSELFAVHTEDHLQRKSLKQYSLPYLDSLINTASTTTVIAYGLFSTSYEKDPNVILSLPIVYYAVMRYKRTILIPTTDVEKLGEQPEKILFSPINICLVILWLVTYYITSRGYISILR